MTNKELDKMIREQEYEAWLEELGRRMRESAARRINKPTVREVMRWAVRHEDNTYNTWDGFEYRI